MVISSRVRSGLPFFHGFLRSDSPALAQISAASDRNPSLKGVRNFSTQAKDADAKVKQLKPMRWTRLNSEIHNIIAASKNSPLFSQFIKDLSVPRVTRVKPINGIFGQAGFPDITKNFLVPNPTQNTMQNTSVPRIPGVPAFDALEVERLKRQRLAPQQGTRSQQQLPLQPNQTASEGTARNSRKNEHASSTPEMEQLTKQHQEVLQQIELQQRLHLQDLRELQKEEEQEEQEEVEAARRMMLQLQGKRQQNQGSSSNSSMIIHHTPGMEQLTKQHQEVLQQIGLQQWQHLQDLRELQKAEEQEETEAARQLMLQRKRQQNWGSSSNSSMEIHHPGSMLVSTRPNMGIAMQPNPTENTSMAGISIGNEYAGPVFGQQQDPQQEQWLQQLLEFERHDPQQEQLLQQLLELVRHDPQQETQLQQSQQHQLLELQQQDVQQQQQEQLLQQQKELRRQRKYLLQQSMQRRPQQKQLQRQQQHKRQQQQQGYLQWRQQYEQQQQEQQQGYLQWRQQYEQQQQEQQQQQLQPQQQQPLPRRQQQQLRSPQIEPERLAIFNCLCSDLKAKRRSSENFLAVVSILLADQPEFLRAIEEAVNNGHL